LRRTSPSEAPKREDGKFSNSNCRLDCRRGVRLHLSQWQAAQRRADAEALAGLARALIYDGARALLVTYWQVDTQAAVELVTVTFAERRRDAGVRLAEALRKPMSAMIAGGGSKGHPSYCEPFGGKNSDRVSAHRRSLRTRRRPPRRRL
jgi:CHAT domain-containing protein